MHKCYMCKEYKESDKFYKDRSKKSGISSACKSCSNSRTRYNGEYNRQWRLRNPDKVREYQKRKDSKLTKKIKNNLRKRLRNALHGNFKVGSAIQDLGCSIDDFKNFFKNKFEPGMSWENYGEWHIDHIIPMVSFDLTNPEEVKKCCHYTNLQPLWAFDNLSKGDKLAK